MRASSCLIDGQQLHKWLHSLLCLCFRKVLTVYDVSPLLKPFTSAFLCHKHARTRPLPLIRCAMAAGSSRLHTEEVIEMQ